MRALVEMLLQQYGSNVTVVNEDGSTTVRAFLQPVTSKSWQNMERMIPNGGQIPRGQYLLICPCDADIREADHLRFLGKKYLLRRVDVIACADEELFQWGLLVEGGRNDPWTS